MPKTRNNPIQKFANLLRQRNSDIIVGPVRQGSDDTSFAGTWYFVTASADNGEAQFDAIRGEDRELTEQLRGMLLYALIGGKPLVIHDVDDEVTLVQLADVLWPSEKTRTMRANVEAELD